MLGRMPDEAEKFANCCPLRMIAPVTLWKSSATWRCATTALMLVAWLVLTNHCALGLMQSRTDAVAAHDCCHPHSGADPAPATPDETPLHCCKTVKATPSQPGHTGEFSAPLLADFLLAVTMVIAPVAATPTHAEVGIHGPPGLITFAERVLQQSLLSHAPPSVE